MKKAIIIENREVLDAVEIEVLCKYLKENAPVSVKISSHGGHVGFTLKIIPEKDSVRPLRKKALRKR